MPPAADDDMTPQGGEVPRPLSAMQARFVEEYLIDANGTQAAIRAGYSKATAYAKAGVLLKEPRVCAAIVAGMQARSERLQITADQVVRELARIAFGDPRKVMRWSETGVQLRDSTELTDDEAAVVSEVSETRTAAGGSLKIKTHDKVRALELLGKHLGMFTERVKIEGPAPLEEELARFRAAQGGDEGEEQ